ncbi:hypothetical protein LSAT2_023935 [Lamellibrachia satsuma]|nr:hypothetical protein LSAT2_023935 [Lamellibrachia satsuma]
MTLGAVATILCPLCNTYPLLALYAAVYGVCIASFISLQSIILVELIGLDMLTNAFILMCLFKGTGCYVGPPLAGWLCDMFPGQQAAFYLSGSAMTLAGLLSFTLRPLANRKKRLVQLSSIKSMIPSNLPTIGLQKASPSARQLCPCIRYCSTAYDILAELPRNKQTNIRQWFEQQFKDPAVDPIVPFTGEPLVPFTGEPLVPFTGELRPLIQPITPEEIQRAQKSLRNSRATVPDGIQKELLKYAGYAFSTAISRSINTVFETYITLDAVGRGILVPLPKPWKQLGPLSNLRPIAILNSIRKILSTVVLRRIQNNVNLFTGSRQSGFKQCRSCVDIVWAQHSVGSNVMPLVFLKDGH